MYDYFFMLQNQPLVARIMVACLVGITTRNRDIFEEGIEFRCCVHCAMYFVTYMSVAIGRVRIGNLIY